MVVFSITTMAQVYLTYFLVVERVYPTVNILTADDLATQRAKTPTAHGIDLDIP